MLLVSYRSAQVASHATLDAQIALTQQIQIAKYVLQEPIYLQHHNAFHSVRMDMSQNQFFGNVILIQAL